MQPIHRYWHCQAICVPGHQANLFSEKEALAIRVGEMDLDRERLRRRHFLGRYFEKPGNALANAHLEALRALVVLIGTTENDDVLEAVCIGARDAGLSETQIAFVVARHRPGASTI